MNPASTRNMGPRDVPLELIANAERRYSIRAAERLAMIGDMIAVVVVTLALYALKTFYK